MSRVVTAAEQLIKLAEELEREAAEHTVFACMSCGHTNTLRTMNEGIRKYASSLPSEEAAKFDVNGALISVGDKVKCPACKSANMQYMATPDSERFYITAAEEDTPSVAAPVGDAPDYGMEAQASMAPKDILHKLSKFPSSVLKQVRDSIPAALRMDGDSPFNKDKYHGVDPSTHGVDSPWELPRTPQVQEGFRALNSVQASEEKEAFFGGKSLAMSLAALFVAVAPQVASAAGHKSLDKSPEAMQQLFDKVMGNLQSHNSDPNLHEYQVAQVDHRTGEVSKTEVPAPSVPGAQNTSAVPAHQVGKSASINMEKLASYLG